MKTEMQKKIEDFLSPLLTPQQMDFYNLLEGALICETELNEMVKQNEEVLKLIN